MPPHDDPATKSDVVTIRDELAATRSELKGEIAELSRDVELFTHEIKRHFDVMVEDLRHDLLGARSDEVEVLKDSRADHERRIRRLEKTAGVAA